MADGKWHEIDEDQLRLGWEYFRAKLYEWQYLKKYKKIKLEENYRYFKEREEGKE